ncbi:MAG: hypothetical protein AAFY17_07780 [Cyanobacteria bacterium J06642_11]
MTSSNDSSKIHTPYSNVATEQAIEALRQHSLTLWWRLTALVWLTIGPLTLWQLRVEIGLLLDYFTWAAVYYGLKFNLLGALGFFFCIGLASTVVVRELRHLTFGLSPLERRRLETQLAKIRKQGESHPLWSLVNRP